MARRLRIPLLIVALLSASSGAITRGQGDNAFAEVMRRVHEYVAVYEDHELSTVRARERYHQQLMNHFGEIKGERTLLADYLLLQLPDEDWVAVRDVYDVDGEPVEGRAAKMDALFAGPRDELGARAMRMAEESMRYNLGELYYRTVNLPTFALRMLRPANRRRMAFSRAGEDHIDGAGVWIIACREVKGPTFSATADGVDLPATARFWVDPETGAVVRSEMIIGGTRRMSARATITVSYARDPALGFRVPVEMQERYDNPRRTKDDVVLATATYSDFRRFDWRALVPRVR